MINLFLVYISIPISLYLYFVVQVIYVELSMCIICGVVPCYTEHPFYTAGISPPALCRAHLEEYL